MRMSAVSRGAVSGLILVLAGCASAAEQPASIADFVKARFLARVTADFRLPRIDDVAVGADDVRRALNRRLEPDVFANAHVVESRGITVVQDAPARKAHAAILVLRYPDAATAQRMQTALEKQGGFFKSTEILTRYASFAAKGTLVLVYSETVANPSVQSFLNSIPAELRDSALVAK
jgi:hypothetical protein